MKKKTKNRKIKALVLLSGGLDSMLAAKILKKQKIDVMGLCFKSYFFSCEKAKKASRELKIPLIIVNFSLKHLKMVKEPNYGYGKGMNPCIDCHLLMLKKAKTIMKQRGFDFVATGEVLNERPMSQNRKALKIISKASSLNSYLLRPLSAKLLEPTIPEKRGWVKREMLFAISGRSRKKQIVLAKRFNLKDYPHPGGGCLLTDPIFSQKLKQLLTVFPLAKGSDIELLKIGRHFWIFKNRRTKIIVGRNHEENIKLEKLKQKNDILVVPQNFKGPSALIRNYQNKKISNLAIKKAKELIKRYTKKSVLKSKFLIKT